MVFLLLSGCSGRPASVQVRCDVQGYIVAPDNIDTRVANASLEDQRLAHRLGRTPWADPDKLRQAVGCP